MKHRVKDFVYILLYHIDYALFILLFKAVMFRKKTKIS